MQLTSHALAMAQTLGGALVAEEQSLVMRGLPVVLLAFEVNLCRHQRVYADSDHCWLRALWTVSLTLGGRARLTGGRQAAVRPAGSL